MRTTLTIDEDVAAALERLRRSRDQSFKDLVNEALRMGIRQMSLPAKKRAAPYRTRAVDAGRCLVGDLDNVAEALAIAEGEDFK